MFIVKDFNPKTMRLKSFVVMSNSVLLGQRVEGAVRATAIVVSPADGLRKVGIVALCSLAQSEEVVLRAEGYVEGILL